LAAEQFRQRRAVARQMALQHVAKQEA
jgi:hypothetical protein